MLHTVNQLISPSVRWLNFRSKLTEEFGQNNVLSCTCYGLIKKSESITLIYTICYGNVRCQSKTNNFHYFGDVNECIRWSVPSTLTIAEHYGCLPSTLGSVLCSSVFELLAAWCAVYTLYYYTAILGRSHLRPKEYILIFSPLSLTTPLLPI